MANELSIINQPDSVPGAISTGYQAQNTIIEAQRNGFDGTAPYASSSTQVTLPIGGPVDVNGVLYSVSSAAVLSLAAADTDYYIYLAGTGSNLTPTITSDAGTFDATKNARYTAGGERILDWVCRRVGSTVYVGKMVNKEELASVDQDLRVNSSPVFAGVTCSTLNTGQGDNELYDMNQNVLTSSAPTFAGLTLNGSLNPETTPVETVTTVGTYIFPRGIYNFRVSLQTHEVFIGGSWRTTGLTGGTIFSDGTTTRVSGTSSPLYLLKF